MKNMKPANVLPIVANDPWLEPFSQTIHERHAHYQTIKHHIEKIHGSLYNFAGQHLEMGIHYDAAAKGWWYREWAPQAYQLWLTGDFNAWNRTSHPMERRADGIWEIFLDGKAYKSTFRHGSKIKVIVSSRMGMTDRIPAYIRRVVQDEASKDFAAQLWMPDKPFVWTDGGFKPDRSQAPIIYESHVGMAVEREGLGTYREFADNILPYVKECGYNMIQLMAIQEHPYYGSFGYHVSSFFAPSSRFGTPEDLKYLINKAHEMGIAVIMDIVHSHAVKNVLEGLNLFDGTDHQYFHPGGRGEHPLWDSRLFNYGNWEVLRFLLSNVRYWLEEFHFDGFRFDGVTSMLYLHHGNVSFNSLADYYTPDTDTEAVTYLTLANELAHTIRPECVTIAEDVSGMPGLGQAPERGGVGFDYRLGMGLPDYWIKLLKHYPDEGWNLWEMWHVMSNRREDEKTIAYCESHDQALVGDKTLAFWLMDKEMYTHMSKSMPSLVVDRGVALHKMIRMFTISLGGEGYLNFMGNEFGHPEWIDFPREGNGWSYKYARRQWSLVKNGFLRYEQLGLFDRYMTKVIREHGILDSPKAELLNMDETNKTVIFKRGDLIFIFNFHATSSIPNYRFFVGESGSYRIILNSDNEEFGGFGRVNNDILYPTDPEKSLLIYLTNRTVLVMKKEADEKGGKASAGAKKPARSTKTK